MASASDLAQSTFDRLFTLQDRLNVWDGYAPTGAGETYVVFYPESGGAYSDRHSGLSNVLGWGCYLICAGRTRLQVLRAVDLVRGCLVDFYPDSSPAGDPLVETETGSTMQRDPNGGLFSLTLRYTLTTTRS